MRSLHGPHEHIITLCEQLNQNLKSFFFLIFSIVFLPSPSHHPQGRQLPLDMAAEIDEQSLRLCIRLQGQDAIALIKGKKREDEQPPDVEFAAELYKFELQSLQTFYYDRALCRRLHRLDLENGDPLGSRAGKEKPAPKKPDNEVALAQPSRRSALGTGASVSIVDEETTKQSNDEVASTRSTTSSTSGTSISAKNVERRPNNRMMKSHQHDPA